MRWYIQTDDEAKAAFRAKHTVWRRHFAWLPCFDNRTRIRFWLEFVWRRGSGKLDGYVRDIPRAFRPPNYKGHTFERWEYRGGRAAPEVAQPAPGQTSTVV